ncbi:hypothetical protein F2Q69_00031033 [Brassica cretica]|uniref:Uncharacterized protein n=1 Tax=Brassica cretica TaxID=69181 RepID=A0A8S9RZ95_BRACR|nr:hypothetical protein F2Q69_00031033 [Brassica cretica]
MPYLTNQEGLSHETNFNGLYTQEGVQPILNQYKIFTEQDVMNFTSQRFSSLSICEYPTLEGDLSSIKIQSPKPVNPVLHWPQLEATRFNQLQTRHWRPGDHFNQSGDILGVQEEFCKFIPCTSNHWIRRILIYSNLPHLEQTNINVQQLFFLQIRHDIGTYQAPRKLTSVDCIFRCLFQPVAKVRDIPLNPELVSLRDTKTFVLAAHCMEIAGHMDVYASGTLYGDCGGTKTFVLAAHM